MSFSYWLSWAIDLSSLLQERPDLVESERNIPSIMAQTCRDWWDYTGDDVVMQIDSGL
jgi:hypothetical protein